MIPTPPGSAPTGPGAFPKSVPTPEQPEGYGHLVPSARVVPPRRLNLSSVESTGAAASAMGIPREGPTPKGDGGQVARDANATVDAVRPPAYPQRYIVGQRYGGGAYYYTRLVQTCSKFLDSFPSERHGPLSIPAAMAVRLRNEDRLVDATMFAIQNLTDLSDFYIWPILP